MARTSMMLPYSVADSILWTAVRGFAIGLVLCVFGLALTLAMCAPIWMSAMVR